MSPDDAEEYTAALGQIVGGGYRQVALGVRLGVPQALGLTTREWVDDRLGGYVRLSIPERQVAVAELVADGMSNRQVADVLGVNEITVRRDATNVAVASSEQVEQIADATNVAVAEFDFDEYLADAELDQREEATRHPTMAAPPIVQALRDAQAALSIAHPADGRLLDGNWSMKARTAAAAIRAHLDAIEGGLPCT